MRKIGRTIFVSKCYGSMYNSKTRKIVDDYYFEVYGKYTPKQATNYANRKNKNSDETITIYDVDYEKRYYKINVEDFIKYGERVY